MSLRSRMFYGLDKSITLNPKQNALKYPITLCKGTKPYVKCRTCTGFACHTYFSSMILRQHSEYNLVVLSGCEKNAPTVAQLNTCNFRRSSKLQALSPIRCA